MTKEKMLKSGERSRKRSRRMNPDYVANGLLGTEDTYFSSTLPVNLNRPRSEYYVPLRKHITSSLQMPTI
jgi:hypothetical protein